MTGIEVIVNQILDEAKDKEQEILQDAEKEIYDISRQAKDLAAKYEKDLANKTEKELKNYESVAQLMAQQKKRRAILMAKQQFIEDIINKTYEKLVNLDSETYFNYILKLVGKYALEGQGEIVFNKKDLERMPAGFIDNANEKIKEKGGSLKLSEKTGEIESGFVLIYGGIEENCTFRALLDIEREKLNDLVNQKVFC